MSPLPRSSWPGHRGWFLATSINWWSDTRRNAIEAQERKTHTQCIYKVNVWAYSASPPPPKQMKQVWSTVASSFVCPCDFDQRLLALLCFRWIWGMSLCIGLFGLLITKMNQLEICNTQITLLPTYKIVGQLFVNRNPSIPWLALRNTKNPTVWFRQNFQNLYWCKCNGQRLKTYLHS